jgi:hypothetical protein
MVRFAGSNCDDSFGIRNQNFGGGLAISASDELPPDRGLLPLAIRFKLVNRDRSFRVSTERLGPRLAHGGLLC